MRLAIRDRRTSRPAPSRPAFPAFHRAGYKRAARGVFVQITAEARKTADPASGGEFGVIKAAQARGDFDVLTERAAARCGFTLSDCGRAPTSSGAIAPR